MSKECNRAMCEDQSINAEFCSAYCRWLDPVEKENAALVERWAYMDLWIAIETASDTSEYCHKSLLAARAKMKELEGGEG